MRLSFGPARSPAAALLLALFCSPSGVADGGPSCKNISAGTLAFGVYDPLSAVPTDSASVISYSCANSISVQVALSGDPGRTFARTLNGPNGAKLDYDLYATAARNVVWGDGTHGTVTIHVDSNGHSVSVFGRIPAKQSASAGGYSDTITVTFNF